MGNVMTGRQAYGDYDSTASENKSDHIDDPLAELARIVSEGDEYLRRQRLEAEAEGPLDESAGYEQAVEAELRNEAEAASAPRGYAPASYQPETPEFHEADAGQPDYVQSDYQQSDYRETDYQEADYRASDSRDQHYQQPESPDQNQFEQETYPAEGSDLRAYSDDEFAENRYADEAMVAETSAPEIYQQQTYEHQTVQVPDDYGAAAGETGVEAVSDTERHPDEVASITEFQPLPAVADPFETVSNATGAMTDNQAPSDNQAPADNQIWADTASGDYDDQPAEYAAADSYAIETQQDLRDPYFNEADFQPAVEPVAESTEYSADTPYYTAEAQGEPVEIYSTADSAGTAPDIQLDPAALVGADGYADAPYNEAPEPFARGSDFDAGYETEPRMQYDPQPDPQPETVAWPQEGDPYTIEPRESGAMHAAIGPQDGVDAGDLSYGVGADGDLVETVPPIASDTDPNIAAAEPASRNLGLKAMAAVVALSLLGGGGLFAYRTFGGAGATSEPKVIKADAGPFKVEADASTQTGTAKTPGSGVYQRLSGDGRTDKSQERIVVGKEEPVNVARNSDQTNAVEQRSTLPKPVKTIVVKPDGTFVSRPDPRTAQPATNAQSPSRATPSAAADQSDKAPKSVARVVTTTPIRTVTTNRTNEQSVEPVVSGTKPAAAVSQRAQSAAETIANANPAVVTSLAEAGRQGDPTVTGRAEEETAPPANAITVVPRAKPPVPAQRTRAFAASEPSAAPAAETRAPAETAPTQTAPAPQTQTAATQTRATPAIPKGAYIVQVSSQRSRKQAQDAYSSLQRRFPSVLGKVQPVIQKADLGDRGTYYRVRLGPYQQQAAARLCSNLKSAGGDCFVRRN